ncbi:recombinase family protein [Paracoccus denitrificans]|jgi:DNA invertase Pin-like site-specific DNA recombinase|uniref:Recombinase n=2 Tax=Paracoccus denitrificans TaxID=266 RepID=A1AZ05_PARDP|nr:recombinase family protein [Paracoccus denitrificans]ABL68499.1 Recombinase [Paracoccus denitrificans PD1222]MCU7427057.1 recombinase family protein [Paracoccus denitrificans]UFS65260.1 recombinase family protein [Paracoccus denitrificans]UPV95517.1 recombinase family protein [Paracoccus denitrificans]WQO32417.1 recombinase family protein [Paracoccus denitrificans]
MRCAIYTRKSADERAGAEFGSLENQRSFCASYIASQGGQGWDELPNRYDDEGYSGGSLKRPSLDRLRADIQLRKLDTVVVYKIDRLSRSLRDFCNLVAEFEACGVTFVSVTQSFDTGTAMGRLTLNVLLSFAQFERELTGERLKDWFAGARERGLWVQQRPFGYAKPPGTNQLVPHETEAPVVRWIFRRYIALKSAERVADDLYARGITNTRGKPWTGNMVRHTITHPIYRGKMVHRRQAMPGSHEPIVSDSLWRRANAVLADARNHRMGGRGAKPLALLAGLLFDRTGSAITHTFLTSKGRLYRYYIAQQERRHGYGEDSDPYMRFRAADLEAAVLEVVQRMTGYDLGAVRAQYERIERLRTYIERIDVDLEGMTVVFRAGGSVRAEAAGRLGPRRHTRREKRGRPQQGGK